MFDKIVTVTICSAFLLISCSAALCGTINATTEDGKRVILYPDGRWDYIKNDTDSMPDIGSPSKQTVKGKYGTYGLRYNGNLWKLQNGKSNSQAEFRFVHADGDVYAMILSERIETSLETLKNIALQNTRAVAPDAKIALEEKRMVNGREVLCLQIDATVAGIPFTYFGYYYAGSAGSIQIVTYTGRNLFNEYKKDMTDFLNGFAVYK